MALWQWSKTASSNATADPTMNWSEGIPPSIVNDNVRAEMARVAEWRDDMSGLLVTGGTSTAYTLTTNQGLASTPNDGQLIVFSPHTTNGAAAALAADGGTAFPFQSSPGNALGAGALTALIPYQFKFRAASSAWILFGSGTAASANVASAVTAGAVTGTGIANNTITAANLVANIKQATIGIIIDGGGSPLTTGQKGFIEVPFSCTINRSTLLADQTGSVVVDVWRVPYSSFPPSSANKITASAPPTISSAQTAQDSTLTGWTTSLSAGDILAFNVNSAATIQRATLSLLVTKS